MAGIFSHNGFLQGRVADRKVAAYIPEINAQTLN